MLDTWRLPTTRAVPMLFPFVTFLMVNPSIRFWTLSPRQRHFGNYAECVTSWKILMLPWLSIITKKTGRVSVMCWFQAKLGCWNRAMNGVGLSLCSVRNTLNIGRWIWTKGRLSRLPQPGFLRGAHSPSPEFPCQPNPIVHVPPAKAPARPELRLQFKGLDAILIDTHSRAI